MYADSGLLHFYTQSFSPEIQQLEEYYDLQMMNAPSTLYQSILDPISAISEYDWEAESELFKAPAPLAEEREAVDPMTAALSMISCGDEASPEMSGGDFFSDIFCDAEKAAGEPALAPPKPIKSVSLECLSPTNWAAVKTDFLEFPAIDFAYGMRRAYSEGDIETLSDSSNNMNFFGSRSVILSSEDRKEKLSRYRSKKSKRNFDRKIKYACRKALADSQPRIRGRFAKTEELDSLSKSTNLKRRVDSNM